MLPWLIKFYKLGLTLQFRLFQWSNNFSFSFIKHCTQIEVNKLELSLKFLRSKTQENGWEGN